MGVEKPFSHEFLFQLLEGQLKVAKSSCFHGLNDQLKISPLGVKRNAPATENTSTVFRPKNQGSGLGSEHYATNLGVFIFEGEIPVPRRGRGKVGYFPLDPDLYKVILNSLFEQGIQAADSQDFFGMGQNAHNNILGLEVDKLLVMPYI